MEVKITDTAKKQIKILPENIRKKIYDKLQGLLTGKTEFKRLKNNSLYSSRVGDYRILFDRDKEKNYIIKTVRHRREVYRDI